MKIYAYNLPNGDQGIVSTWGECKSVVSGVSNAEFKAFKDNPDGTAEEKASEWLKSLEKARDLAESTDQ